MLNFNDILSFYPKKQQAFKKNILKEYLQYKILDVIFSTKYAQRLVFIGETAIRIIHNSYRFSEDLDFDNFSIKQADFKDISRIIKHQLELEGYRIEIKNVFKNAFHCYIKFPDILFQTGLSSHRGEKILIQLDTEPQRYNYTPDKYLLNKFGIFRYINTPPIELLLSQKISAILTRKREKGRDFFDVVHLMSKTEPDLNFLKIRFNINSKKELIKKLDQKAKQSNLKTLSQDIEPFLFDPSQKNRVLYFRDWLKTL